MSFKEKIFQEIKSDKLGCTKEELRRRLHVRSKAANTSFEKFLRELQNDGRVFIENGMIFAGRPKVVKGRLKGNRRGFAFLIREDGGEDIFIPNRSLNGALHGDTVRVRVMGGGEGEVVGVDERGNDKLVGTYIKLEQGGYVIPDNKDFFTYIYVPHKLNKGSPNNSKVIVKVKPDPQIDRVNGEILRVLGKSGERGAEVLSILHGYGFEDQFPQKVLEAAEAIKYEPDFEGRTDLRDLYTITIDGEDAKDFDDAISLQRAEGGYILYVHIADVSHYVPRGSAIDKEALERGTSVYFPDSVFPMLPETLSNGVCSLRPNEEKLTLTVKIELDGAGNIRNREFMKSVIKSNRRMTYLEVAEILKGGIIASEYEDVKDMLFACKELAGVLRRKRNAAGAINFISDETKIILDSDGRVLDIAPYPLYESNEMIEMFMVLANEVVAEYIKGKGVPCVYRVHQRPSEEKMEGFVEFINAMGLWLDVNKGVRPKLLADFLESIKGGPAERLISRMLLRSMAKAKYDTKNEGHFGLSLESYCHFTSPIRRYPDLMVHRALKAIIDKKDNKAFRDSFAKACEEAASRSSERELASEKAERDIDDYYKAVYMSDKIGEAYKGIISGVTPYGIFVELPNTVEGFIPIDSLPRDRYETDVRRRLVGTRYVFATGDQIDIIIASVDTTARKIYMDFAGQAADYMAKPKKAKNLPLQG